MSKVSMTARQIMDLGLWDKVCDYTGMNPYAMNEGQVSYDEIIEFDSEFKKVEEKSEQEITLEKYLGGNIKIRPAYGMNFGIDKDEQTIFVGTWDEISGFISGVAYMS